MKQNLGLGVILAVAVAAVRYTGSGVSVVPSVASTLTSTTAPLAGAMHDQAISGAYRGGCTAFDPGAGANEPYPKDDNREAAKSVLDKFFAFDPSVPTSTSMQAAGYTGVHYAIALTPDPRHTNLSLTFDREMVLIQQAAQDENYTYSSSWLPWKNEAASSPLLADQQRIDDAITQREACPGILLFRKSLEQPLSQSADPAAPTAPAKPANPYAEALVVFVVGEQPTGGLNENQWANAVHWLATNPASGSPAPLSILGPSHSGSLVSLQRDLARLYRGPSSELDAGGLLRRFPHVNLLSGVISGCVSIQWFQRKLEDPLFNKSITFGTFAENDDLKIYRFLSYVHAQGTEIRDVSILSEDETAYASDGPMMEYPKDEPFETGPPKIDRCSFNYDPNDSPLKLAYPRDISALRSAYEKQSVFSGPSQAARAIHPILQESPESGGDNSGAADTIHSYSGSFSAVAQEAILYGIVSELRVHHTRYLLLRCSNPLDFLFLTRFFHRAYSETRIVTVTSDLLFRREIDTTEFRGVLALTNYPLLPANQHWSRLSITEGSPMLHTHRIFDSNNQGIYIAARYLFDAQSIAGAQHASRVYPSPDEPAPLTVSTGLVLPWMENIPDYADPFWMHQPDEVIHDSHAPVWLSVLGRDGYWPIAVLNKETPLMDKTRITPVSTIITLHSDKAHYSLLKQEDKGPIQFEQELLFKMPFSWSICVALGSGLLLYQIIAVALGSRFTSSGFFAPFRQTAHYRSHAILLGINSAFVVMPVVLLFSVVAALPTRHDLEQPFYNFWFWVLGDTVLIVALLVSLIFRWKNGRFERRSDGILSAGIFLGVLAMLVLIVLITLLHSKTPVNDVSIFYRMTHITSGVSPLVPFLFLFLGFYLWTWQALAGNVLLADGRPLLPAYSGIQKTFGWLNRLDSRLHHRIPDVQGPTTYSLAISEYRLSEEIGKRIVNIASPVCVSARIILVPAVLGVAAFYFVSPPKLSHAPTNLPLLSMEGQGYAIWINLALLIAFLLTTAEAFRLYASWIELRRLLLALNRRRLRRTFSRLRNIGPNSIWSVSGTVQRIQFLFFSQQMDAARRLQIYTGITIPKLSEAIEYGRRFSINSAEKLSAGARWEKPIQFKNLNASHDVFMRVVLADAVAEVLNVVLLPAWSTEDTSLNLECADKTPAAADTEHTTFSLPLSPDLAVRAAEEFVCFHYIAFIQNILARMRTMMLSMVFLFVGVCLSISFYPFVPRTQIGMWMVVNLVLISSTVIYVYAGMERDETLSYITNTPPGRLGSDFYIKTATFLAGPVLGLLTTQFPAISESILGWLQPGLDALK